MLYFVRAINKETDESNFFIASAPSEREALGYFDDAYTYVTEIEPLRDEHIHVQYDSLAMLCNL